uniref:Fe2OG dioxygenase domain-containing protein n=1 Tax=Amphora coffeiformis TaxID=265554 RepID=A0A7S3P4T5_9STRA
MMMKNRHHYHHIMSLLVRSPFPCQRQRQCQFQRVWVLVFFFLAILAGRGRAVSLMERVDDDNTKNNNSKEANKHGTKWRKILQDLVAKVPPVKKVLLDGLETMQTTLRKMKTQSQTPSAATTTTTKTTSTTKPVVVDDFMTPEEAQTLLQRYGPLLHNSLHYNDKLGSVVQSQYRTSRSVRLPPLGDALVFDIEQRAAAVASSSATSTTSTTNQYKFNHSLVEDFQLACYGPGQLYGLHRDDNDGRSATASADRAATVLIYLQEPQRGGATLFTRRPIEEERDVDTKQALRTEAGALKLFQRYCDKPHPQFLVVEPQTGRAVTWLNWYHGSPPHMEDTFAHDSTHGACPVVEGEKCVIQQWISKPHHTLPLRDERVAAIFPCGADRSYRQILVHVQHGPPSDNHHKHQDDEDDENCMKDVSTRRGAYTAQLCLVQKEPAPQHPHPTTTTTTITTTTNSSRDDDDNKDTRLLLRDYIDRQGPYVGVGALGVANGLTTTISLLPTSSSDDDNMGDFTVSFWAKNIANGTTLVTLGDRLRVTAWKSSLGVNNGDPSNEWKLVLSDEWNSTATEPSYIRLAFPANQWMWYSFSMDGRDSTVHFSVVSKRGDLLGTTHWKVQPVDGRILATSTLNLLVAPRRPESNLAASGQSNSPNPARSTFGSPQQVAFVPDSPPSVDRGEESSNSSDCEKIAPLETAEISFVVLHSAVLGEQEMKSLRLQIERYNIEK